MKPVEKIETTIEDTLKERGGNYGAFEDHALLCQEMKHTVQQHPNWDLLDADMKESLEMIMHKMARIINGNPTYVDSWTDISGYATLVEKRLNGTKL